MEGSTRPDRSSYFYFSTACIYSLSQALERRAVKHQARQDDLLLRAITRVWRARERGKLLENIKMIRLLKRAWAVWKRRSRSQKERDGSQLWFLLACQYLSCRS